MPRFKVRWEIEVTAKNVNEAATKAKNLCRERTHISQESFTNVRNGEVSYRNVLGCAASCCSYDNSPDET